MKKVTLGSQLIGVTIVFTGVFGMLLTGCGNSENPQKTVSPSATLSTTLTNSVSSSTKPISTLTPGTMSISLQNRDIKAGDKISVDIMVDSKTGLRGIQCGLDFDPKLMKCDKIDEGGYLMDWAEKGGMSTLIMPKGVIDNEKGHVSKMVILVTGRPEGESDNPGSGASGKGIAATYHFIALADGVASPKITNAALMAIPQGQSQAVEVPVVVSN